MTFDKVLPALRKGSRISREEWNGSRVIVLNENKQISVQPQNDDSTQTWVAGQDDVLADDWYILEDN